MLQNALAIVLGVFLVFSSSLKSIGDTPDEVCAGVVGDLNDSGGTDIVDVQCSILPPWLS